MSTIRYYLFLPEETSRLSATQFLSSLDDLGWSVDPVIHFSSFDSAGMPLAWSSKSVLPERLPLFVDETSQANMLIQGLLAHPVLPMSFSIGGHDLPLISLQHERKYLDRLPPEKAAQIEDLIAKVALDSGAHDVLSVDDPPEWLELRAVCIDGIWSVDLDSNVAIPPDRIEVWTLSGQKSRLDVAWHPKLSRQRGSYEVFTR